MREGDSLSAMTEVTAELH